MATIRFYYAFDMRVLANSGNSFHDSIAGGTLTTNSANLVQIDHSPSGRDSFYGGGLGELSENMPFAGTVYEWVYEVTPAGGFYDLYWDFYDFSVSASTVSNYVLTDRVDLLMSQYIMNGADSVYGSSDNDYLMGYGGDDQIFGNEGNDTLNGGAGGDAMTGGAGDDTYIVDSLGDAVIEANLHGNDSIVLLSNFGGSVYLIPETVENIRNAATLGASMTGNAFNNVITGTNVYGDVLNGLDGNDTLDGGAGGYDTMYGGRGNDVFIVDNSTDFVSDETMGGQEGGGIDEVRASISYSLNDAARTDIENLRLTGSAAINGYGNALNNVLTGNSAANILDGLSGADQMSGGDGNDIYYVDNSADRVIEGSATGGTDRVFTSVTYTLANNVENLTLTGGETINATGNSLGNQLVGNGEANIIYGRDGNDFLYGNGGNDALYGGNGLDQISGGAGDDWIEGGAGQDDLTGGADADSFVFRTGDFAGLTAGSCDRIRDFSKAQSDQIRLNAIDANSANGSGTNEAFTFIGTAAFHNVAGELRYQVINGNTYVYGDTDGNGVADFLIRLDGTVTLSASDFLL